MKKTVLVTGATGFVGTNLVSLLTNAGFDALPYNIRAEQDSKSLEQIAKSCDLQAIIHCAGKINGSTSQLRASNESLMLELTTQILKFNPKLKIIFISSVSAISGLGTYGTTKKNAEEILITSGLENWTILRPSLLYGPNDTKNVATLINLAKRSPIIPVPGPNTVKLQPLHIEDLFLAIHKIIISSEYARKIYITAGPRQEYLWDMVGDIQIALGRRPKRIGVPLNFLAMAIKTVALLAPWAKLPVQQVSALHSHPPYDNSLAHKELGFNPRLFKLGIHKLISEEPTAS